MYHIRPIDQSPEMRRKEHEAVKVSQPFPNPALIWLKAPHHRLRPYTVHFTARFGQSVLQQVNKTLHARLSVVLVIADQYNFHNHGSDTDPSSWINMFRRCQTMIT
jgi:hypothetical protein